MRSLSKGILVAVAVGVLSATAAHSQEQAPPSDGTEGGVRVPRASKATVSREEIDALRRELQSLRRLVQTLEQRIQALSTSAASMPPAQPMAGAPPPSDPRLRTSQPVPTTAGLTTPTRRPSLQNPAVSVVFEVTGATSIDHQRDDNGFDLSEAEIALQAVVDPFTRADLFIAFPAHESPEIEEAYVSTLNLPGPLQLKGGRYKSFFGKWNRLHSHAYFTTDLPNALESFLGEESLTSDGLSLSVLIPNPWDLYLESITEVGSATAGPSFNSNDRELMYLEHLKAFFDTTANSTLEIGATGAWGRTGSSESLLETIDALPIYSGPPPEDDFDSRLFGLDITYKWRPVGFNVYRSFLWQTELLRNRRDVEFLVDPMTLGRERVESLGGYSYVEWQFARRWRAGARYDKLEFPHDDRQREWAASTLLRFQPSEFQEIRFQIKLTRRNPSAASLFDNERDDTQIFIEWIPSIGAHAAHEY